MAAILDAVSGRELPASLREVLRRVRDLEAVAAETGHERAAIAATSALLLAAYEAGWAQAELARFLGMNQQTVHNRIDSARRAHPDRSPALSVEAPPGRPPNRLALLTQPIEQRQWLVIAEAAEHVTRDQDTIRNWLARGVLPNTDRRGGGVHLYLRADLDRVLAGPFRGPRGKYPDFERLLEQIADARV